MAICSSSCDAKSVLKKLARFVVHIALIAVISYVMVSSVVPDKYPLLDGAGLFEQTREERLKTLNGYFPTGMEANIARLILAQSGFAEYFSLGKPKHEKAVGKYGLGYFGGRKCGALVPFVLYHACAITVFIEYDGNGRIVFVDTGIWDGGI